jgi:hypothetical protein
MMISRGKPKKTRINATSSTNSQSRRSYLELKKRLLGEKPLRNLNGITAQERLQVNRKIKQIK